MGQSDPASHTGKMSSNRKLHSGVIYHPVLGYPIPPPVPVAVARRNARERNRVKTVNDSYQYLKNHVPGAARQKRMSKVDIIKHSIQYIQKLQKMVEHSEKSSIQFPTFQPQEINNMQSENDQTAFFPPFQNDYNFANSNQSQELALSPSPSTSSDSTCSPSTSSPSSQLLSSYLSSVCS